MTAGEQDFFKSKGFDVCVPSRCKPCTAAKKARYGDRYGAVPDATGRASTPDSGRCRNCGQVIPNPNPNPNPNPSPSPSPNPDPGPNPNPNPNLNPDPDPDH